MTEVRGGRRRRQRGEVEELPSGALRVKVYAGEDPLTGRRHFLRETIPAGPTAAREAEKARTRLLNQVDEQRNPRTKATVNQLMDRYLELLDVEVTTRTSYEGYINNDIRPLLGKLSIGKLTGETLDSFTRCSVDVARTATADRPSNTSAACRTIARRNASHTNAVHWLPHQSGKYISVSAVRSSGPCAGIGSETTR
ncbi:MAG: hypothetical protein ABIZ05_01950 [Pseudonocardiaceae bacterium]